VILPNSYAKIAIRLYPLRFGIKRLIDWRKSINGILSNQEKIMKVPASVSLSKSRKNMKRASKPTPKSDVCPHCGKHTGIFAQTYCFNLNLMDCPYCGKCSISDFVQDPDWKRSGKGIFAWRKLRKR